MSNVNSIHSAYNQIVQILSLYKSVSKEDLKIKIDELFALDTLDDRVEFIATNFGAVAAEKLRNHLIQIGATER